MGHIFENQARIRSSSRARADRGTFLKKTATVASGAAVVVALFLLHDADTLLHEISQAGAGLLVVCSLAPIFWLFSAEAWRALFEKSDRPPFQQSIEATAIGTAVNTLFPVFSIGGEIVKTRYLADRELPAHAGIGALWADKTVQAVTMVLWAITGLMIGTFLSKDPMILASSISGVAILTLGIAGFVGVQHLNPNSQVMNLSRYLLPKLPTESLNMISSDADRYLYNIYRRPRALAWAILLRYMGRATLVLEISVVGLLLDRHIPILDAFVIAGLVYAARGVGFAMPARLGIQEGGYIAAGSFLGYPGETMLVLALAARLREVGAHIPILIFWQYNLINGTRTKRKPRDLSISRNCLDKRC